MSTDAVTSHAALNGASSDQQARTARHAGLFVAAGLAAAALGAAGMFVALRGWPGGQNQAPAPAPAAAPARDMSQAGMADMPGMTHAPAVPSVHISAERQQLIGVRTTPVVLRTIGAATRLTGTLAYDETRITVVHTKVAGWIDQVYVDFIGQPVEKGQPLFSIYSPELMATERDYLLARRAQRELETSRFEETRRSAASLLAAARTRLALWDLTDAQIAELDATGEPRKTVTVHAPSSGVVVERGAFAGQYLTPETSALRLADLSTVWAVGQVAESEAASVHTGQRVTIERPNAPGTRPIDGVISFIAPEVDPVTRRVRVRAAVANPTGVLKPDTFITMTLSAQTTRVLAVPAEAVIDTGDKRYVILARDGGHFEPRIVLAGAAQDGFCAILQGLAAGDVVVTSAQFLIDSETNLQSAMQSMAGMPGMDMGPKKSGSR